MTQEWAITFGGQRWDSSHDLVIHSGIVFVTGFFEGTSKIGSTTVGAHPDVSFELKSYNDSPDGVVLALNASTGLVLWGQQFGGPGADQGYGIAASDAGRIFVTGYFENTASFGSYTLNATGKTGFITALSFRGEYLWAFNTEQTGTDRPGARGVVADGAGISYTTGNYFDASAGGATSHGGADVFVVALSSAGGNAV